MHGIETAKEITVLLVVTLLLTLLLIRMRLPKISGLVVVGALLSLFGIEFKLYPFEREPILVLSELSIFALMLYGGLNTPFTTLVKQAPTILIGGSVQIALTMALGIGAAYLIVPDCSLAKAIVAGMLMSTSSVAWIFHQSRTNKDSHNEVGEVSEQILISHDLVLLIFALTIPKLASAHIADHGEGGFVFQFIIGVVSVVGVFGIGYLLVSPMLNYINDKFDPEMFYFSVAVLVACTTVVCMWANLAPAFGFFLGGVMIAKTRYRIHLKGIVGHARDIALPVFFLAIGLQVQWQVLSEHWVRIGISVLGLVGIKLIAATIAAWVVGLPLRKALRVGAYHSHIGESAFVLAAMSEHSGLLNQTDTNVMLMLAVVSIGLGPVLLSKRMERIFERVPDITLWHVLPGDPIWQTPTPLQKHVVIIGFGRTGQTIASRLRSKKESSSDWDSLPILVIDRDVRAFDNAKSHGLPAIWGDATLESVLDSAALRDAAVVMITDGGPGLIDAISEYVKGDQSPPIIVRVNTELEEQRIRREHSSAIVHTADTLVQDSLFNALVTSLERRRPKKEAAQLTAAAS